MKKRYDLVPGSIFFSGEEQLRETFRKFDTEIHRKATTAAIHSLETAGLELSPDKLSDLILLLYSEIENKGRKSKIS